MGCTSSRIMKAVSEPQARSNPAADVNVGEKKLKLFTEAVVVEGRYLNKPMTTSADSAADSSLFTTADNAFVGQTLGNADDTADNGDGKTTASDSLHRNKRDLQAALDSAYFQTTAAASAISQSKCHEATEALSQASFDTAPKKIRLREPMAPDLVRITSVSSFGSGGTETKMTSPKVIVSPLVNNNLRVKRMPVPMNLNAKLLPDQNDVQRERSLVMYFYDMANAIMPVLWAVIKMFSTAFSFLARCCHSHACILMTVIQTNPQVSIALFSSMLTFLLHIITVYGSFVWDDRAAILGNPDILGTRPILEVFKHDFWGQDMALERSHKSYRPLTVLSLRLTHFRAGIESASAYHLDNVLIHSIVTYMFSRICSVLVGRYTQKKRRVLLSTMLSSVLFAVHPIHTEAVASVVGRSDLLCALFYLLGLWLHLNGKQSVALAAGICATLSKELGITLFGVFVASDFISFYTSRAKSAGPSQIYRSLLSRSMNNIGIAILLIAFHLKLHGENTLYPWSILENSISLLDNRKHRIYSYAHVHVVYIWKLLFPWKLSYDYGYPCIPHQTSLSWTTIAVFSMIPTSLLTAIKQRNAIMLWSFSLTVIPFIPSSNLFFPIGTILAERLLYLPSMGFCLVSGVVMAGLVDRSDQRTGKSKDKLTSNRNGFIPIAESAYLLIICLLSVGGRFVSGGSIAKLCALHDKVWRKSHLKRVKFYFRMRVITKGLLFIVMCAYMVLMSMKTVQRCIQWSNEGKLFASALHGACPRSLKVLNNYAFQFIETNPHHAIPFLEEAISIHDYNAAHFNLAIAQSHLRRYQESIESFRKSLTLSTDHRTRILLANAINNYLMENGEAKDAYELALEALDNLDLVIRQNTPHPRAYYLRCVLGQYVGHHDNVNVVFCKDALEMNRSLKPNDGFAGFLVIEDVVINSIGVLLKRLGHEAEAIDYFEQGLIINPISSDIMINLASVYSNQERYDLATEYFNRAERLIVDPAVRSLLMTNRGFSMEKQGYLLDAKAIYEEAIDIAGGNPHPQLILNLENLEKHCYHNVCN